LTSDPTYEIDTTAREALTRKSAATDGGSSSERAVAALIRGHQDQKRPHLIYSQKLNQVARYRARDMAKRGYFHHVDPDGYGPNYHVQRMGYQLPIQWTAFPKTNSVESILAGPKTAAEAFSAWMNSPEHRSHIIGQSLFYQKQTHYGVGHAVVPGSKFGHYWVFISAPEEGYQAPRFKF